MNLFTLIRDNTSKEHPLTQAGLRKIPGADEIMGYKNTFTRNLYELADALNIDSQGNVLPKDQWEIVFDGYEARRSGNDKKAKVGKIYYNHDLMRERYSEKKEKDTIVIELDNQKVSNQTVLDTVSKIEQAIKTDTMIEFSFLRVEKPGDRSRRSNLRKSRLYQMSPYKIVHYEGKYWVICVCPREMVRKEDKQPSGIKVYRIDRMCYVDLAKDKRGRKPRRSIFDLDSKIEQIKIPETEGKEQDLFSKKTLQFEVLWKKIPKERRNDYTFVEELFPENWSLSKNVVTICGPCAKVLFFQQYYKNHIKIIE